MSDGSSPDLPTPAPLTPIEEAGARRLTNELAEDFTSNSGSLAYKLGQVAHAFSLGLLPVDVVMKMVGQSPRDSGSIEKPK